LEKEIKRLEEEKLELELSRIEYALKNNVTKLVPILGKQYQKSNGIKVISKDDIKLFNSQLILNLDKLPHKIETYDISNISGEYTVAAMCVMQDGVIKKNLSRRFKIKTVYGQDDPRCTNEVINRRLKHSIENSKGGFGTLPDVIFADGGITQIRAIKEAVKSYNLSIPVFGMVKDDKHRTRALINEDREEFKVQVVNPYNEREEDWYLIDLGNIDRFNDVKEYDSYVASLTPEKKREEAQTLSLKFKSFKDNKVIE
jgi:excinuclease UvrABC nuclease subunit